ncbi:MAG: hypothetical protein IJF11_05560 [Clostridia bacterium]|nr:hypothetical protein [Clostridia bacterium]
MDFTSSDASHIVCVETLLSHIDTHTESISASEGLRIPIGMSNEGVHSLDLIENQMNAMVLGGEKSGKSNFIHTLIMSACYKYSPNELNVYLLDPKGSVEFECYENLHLPHIKLVARGMDATKSALCELEEEIMRRGQECKEQGLTLSQYVAKSRILIVIDEVDLVLENENTRSCIIDRLQFLLKCGRRFGINVVMSLSSSIIIKYPITRTTVLSQCGSKIYLPLPDLSVLTSFYVDLQRAEELKNAPTGISLFNDIRYGRNGIYLQIGFADYNERLEIIKSIIKRWEHLKSYTE